MKLTPNFDTEEFQCKMGGAPCIYCGGQTPPEATMRRMAEKLEVLRGLLGNKPIKIDSGFRCQKRNALLKDASPNSQHLTGNAVDIAIPGGRRGVINAAIQAARAGFTGIGVDVRRYNYIHVDLRDKQSYQKADVWYYE